MAIKGIQLSAHSTVLRLRDADGNEMNGIVWNARVDDELAEKLVPGKFCFIILSIMFLSTVFLQKFNALSDVTV